MGHECAGVEKIGRRWISGQQLPEKIKAVYRGVEGMALAKRTDILLVERSGERDFLIAELLKDETGMNIIRANSDEEALEISKKHDLSLVVVNAAQSDQAGLRSIQSVRQDCGKKHVPLLVVGNADNQENLFQEERKGGVVDYLFQPVTVEAIKRKIRMFLELDRQRRELEKTGERLKQKVADLKKSKHVIEEQNKTLSDYAVRDGLTGLYNRHHFKDVYKQEFARARRYNTDLACLLIDLDFFKQVNDTFGHASGDYVLQEFSAYLPRTTRKTDFVFRYGGEEFLVLLPHTDLLGSLKIAETIRKWSEERRYFDGTTEISVTVSIGISSLVKHQPDRPRDLVAYADKALYRAKAEGRNRVKVYMDEGSEAMTSDLKGLRERRDIRFLKENLAAILEKTKKASLDSLELLVRDLGGTQFEAHNRRVLRYIALIGEKLKLPPSVVDSLKRSAMFHDCFKILLSRKLLTTERSLSDENRAQIEDHPYMLAEMTELFDFFSNERDVLLMHHEHYDGSGYPEGLAGDQIPVGARLFSIVDALVAMTSERPYKKRFSLEEAEQELRANAGTQFDPNLIETVLNFIRQENTAERGA